MRKNTTWVLLKLFINVKERCKTTYSNSIKNRKLHTIHVLRGPEKIQQQNDLVWGDILKSVLYRNSLIYF